MVNSIDTEPGGRVRGRAECLELLSGAAIGQLVFTYRALPDILPVKATVTQDGLLIPFADGSLIERAARNTVVAFHAHRIDETTHLGWSVTVVGRSFELGKGDGAPAEPDGRTLVVVLDRVTGRRLVTGREIISPDSTR